MSSVAAVHTARLRAVVGDMPSFDASTPEDVVQEGIFHGRLKCVVPRLRPCLRCDRMPESSLPQQTRSIDMIDVLYGMLPWGSLLWTTLAWGRVLVRALRGERVDRLTNEVAIASGLAVAALSLISGTRVRESVALRESVGDVRSSLVEVRDSMGEARDLLRQASDDAVERERRNAQRDSRMYRVTLLMAITAGLTLLAAIATLIVALISM